MKGIASHAMLWRRAVQAESKTSAEPHGRVKFSVLETEKVSISGVSRTRRKAKDMKQGR